MQIKVVEIRVGVFEAESIEEFEKEYWKNSFEFDDCLEVKDTVITDGNVITDASVLVK